MAFKHYAVAYFKLKGFSKFLKKHLSIGRINMILSVFMIIVTFISAMATFSVIRLESSLQNELNKAEIRKNIAFTENIINEQGLNMISMVLSIQEFVDNPYSQNSTDSPRIRFLTDRLLQAKNEPTFGTSEIRTGVNYCGLKHHSV